MRRLLSIVPAILACMVSCGGAHQAALFPTEAKDDPGRIKDGIRKTDPDDGLFSPNTLIVMYDKEKGKEPLLRSIREYGAEVIYDYNIVPGIAIRLPEGTPIRKAMAYFRKVEGVTSVERDRVYSVPRHRLTY